jgi:rhodanese-related sulfurtransferase
MKEAEREGLHPMQAIVRGYGRAHYYPGGKESVLKVIAEKGTGRILGAQAVGDGSSDKFIDIVAMALHGRMNCEDLAAVDLAYSPPFSPALSPVIVAANVLMNKMGGDLGWISASEVKEKLETSPGNFQLLDVRDPKEVREKRIPHSLSIPSEALEKRLGELDKNRETAVHCFSGLRSYKASLKLKHAGFDKIKNMDGGILSWIYETEPEEKKT